MGGCAANDRLGQLFWSEGRTGAPYAYSGK
jgi:hypothetical protein